MKKSRIPSCPYGEVVRLDDLEANDIILTKGGVICLVFKNLGRVRYSSTFGVGKSLVLLPTRNWIYSEIAMGTLENVKDIDGKLVFRFKRRLDLSAFIEEGEKSRNYMLAKMKHQK
jgi:hypothetical protein